MNRVFLQRIGAQRFVRSIVRPLDCSSIANDFNANHFKETRLRLAPKDDFTGH